MSVHTSFVRISASRRGFTLVEVSVVMAILGVLLLLVSLTLVGIFRVQSAMTSASNRQANQEALADQFRRDVALASSTPDEWLEWKADGTCLILRMDAKRHIIYSIKPAEVGNAAALERIELLDKSQRSQRLPLGGASWSAKFSRSDGASRTVSLWLTHTRKTTEQPALEILAALGGDR